MCMWRKLPIIEKLRRWVQLSLWRTQDDRPRHLFQEQVFGWKVLKVGKLYFSRMKRFTIRSESQGDKLGKK